MRNTGLGKTQAGIKIAGRNINNLRYADDTTLKAESKEELKSLLMKVKEKSGKAGLKLTIQKTKIMASGPISLVQFSSVAQSCPTLFNPIDCSIPGFPVRHQLPAFIKLMSIESVMPSIISTSVVPFSYCLQSCPASGSFPMSQFFASCGQIIRVSPSASVLPMNIQDWFPLGWTGWISLLSKGLNSLQHHSSKASILQHSAFFIVQLSHPYMTTGKMIAMTRRTLVGKVMSLLFNKVSRLVIIFLPRSKHLSISRLQSPSAVILEPKK